MHFCQATYGPLYIYIYIYTRITWAFEEELRRMLKIIRRFGKDCSRPLHKDWHFPPEDGSCNAAYCQRLNFTSNCSCEKTKERNRLCVYCLLIMNLCQWVIWCGLNTVSYIHTYIHIHIYIHTYIFTYLRTYTRSHTHTHAYIHAYFKDPKVRP
jgi:hypothetical protein